MELGRLDKLKSLLAIRHIYKMEGTNRRTRLAHPMSH